MLLEVEMPNPEVEGTKQRGRVYVCDLAGTEPAGDIVYAIYNKVGGGWRRMLSVLSSPCSRDRYVVVVAIVVTIASFDITLYYPGYPIHYLISTLAHSSAHVSPW